MINQVDGLDEQILRDIGGFNDNCLLNKIGFGSIFDENDDQLVRHSPYIDDLNLKELLKDKKDSFTILSSNMASLRCKFDEFEIFINDLKEQGNEFSVICIQESWISETDDISLLQLKGYNCISQGKYCSSRGGLLIYIKECFAYTVVSGYKKFDDWESQIIEITGSNLSKKLVLGNIYRPPRGNINDYSTFIEEFTELQDILKKVNVKLYLPGTIT